MLKYLLYSLKKKIHLLVYKKHIFSNKTALSLYPYIFNYVLNAQSHVLSWPDENTLNNQIKPVFQTGSARASRGHELTHGCTEADKWDRSCHSKPARVPWGCGHSCCSHPWEAGDRWSLCASFAGSVANPIQEEAGAEGSGLSLARTLVFFMNTSMCI